MKWLALSLCLSSVAGAQEVTPPPLVPAPPVAPVQATPTPKAKAKAKRAERYELENPVPPGFHEEHALRKALFIPGVSLFGAAYLLSASAASSSAPVMAIPFVGPFITAGRLFSGSTSGVLGLTSGLAGLFLIVDGVAQVAGATMAVLGLVFPVRWMEKDVDDGVSLRLTPGPGGVALSGVF